MFPGQQAPFFFAQVILDMVHFVTILNVSLASPSQNMIISDSESFDTHGIFGYTWTICNFQACNDGEVRGGWITFHRSAGRKWLVAFLPLALSAHQVLAASFLSFACGTVVRTLETFAILIWILE